MGGSQQIEFIIRPDGTVEEKITGVNGPECEDITRTIEDALGTVVNRERTSAYYNQSEEQEGDSVSTSA